MQCEGRTYIGNRREQQDSFKAVSDSRGLFAVICDGMGGRANGAQASKAAANYFMNAYQRRNSEIDPEFMLRTAEGADRYVAENVPERCGSTVICVHVSKDKNLLWVSVGDSRLYIFRNGMLKQITKDHNYYYILDKQLKNNEISKQEYKQNSKRGASLISFLGMNGFEIADVSTRPLSLMEGDIAVLASDGLYKALSEDVIEKTLVSYNKDLSECADRILTDVRNCDLSSIDNTTFILIRI